MAAVACSALGEGDRPATPLTARQLDTQRAYGQRMAALATHLKRVEARLASAKATCGEMEDLERALHDKGVSLSRPTTAQERPRPPLAGAAPAARPASANGIRPCTPQELRLELGARCFHRGRFGTVAYLGPVGYAQGEWCGIVLDEPAGKNDGSVKGKKYFECKPKHGLIVRSHECMRADKTRPLKLPKAAFE